MSPRSKVALLKSSKALIQILFGGLAQDSHHHRSQKVPGSLANAWRARNWLKQLKGSSKNGKNKPPASGRLEEIEREREESRLLRGYERRSFMKDHINH